MISTPSPKPGGEAPAESGGDPRGHASPTTGRVCAGGRPGEVRGWPGGRRTFFVSTGADGAFTLYEDDGLTYGYEKGALARIPIRGNDATGTLTIGTREGSFPGMLAQRTFHVVRVGKAKAVGFSFDPKPDRTIPYDGVEVVLRLE